MPIAPMTSPTLDALAVAHAHAALLHVREQAVLAVAVVDHHVVAEEQRQVLHDRVLVERRRPALAVVARAVAHRAHHAVARRVDRRPKAIPILRRRAVGAIQLSLRIGDREVVRVTHEVRVDAEVRRHAAGDVEAAMVREQVVAVVHEHLAVSGRRSAVFGVNAPARRAVRRSTRARLRLSGTWRRSASRRATHHLRTTRTD